MRKRHQWLSTHGGIGGRVAVAACIIALAAMGAMAETPNEIYHAQEWEPPQQAVTEEGSGPEGFSSPTVVSGADFRSDGLNLDSYFVLFTGGYLFGSDSGCLMAPVYVPDGATISEIYGSVYDNDATYDVSVNFKRVDNYNGTVASLATMSSTGQNTSVQSISDLAITNPLVVYPTYSYYLTTCLNTSNQRLYNFRIYWTK